MWPAAVSDSERSALRIDQDRETSDTGNIFAGFMTFAPSSVAF
jgi:hypothetical protein